MDEQQKNSCSGTKVIGDPFWCLMELKNNKITGNIYGSNPGFCLFLNKNDAEIFKGKMPQCEQNRFVVNGINRRYLNLILKQYDNHAESLPPLLVVIIFPTHLGNERIPLFKTTPYEIRYFLETDKFKNKSLQNAFDYTQKITKNTVHSTKNKLNIEPFFDHVETNYANYPRPYINIIKLLESYRKHLRKDINNINEEADNILQKIKSKGQVYSRTISLPHCEYEIAWSITDINNVVKINNITKVELTLKDLVPLVNQSNIVEQHLKIAVNNENPILVTYNPALNPNLCIIDGNHRVIAKYKNNEKTIYGYIIEPKHHIGAMVFNIHKSMYKCHHNIFEYIKYMNEEKEMNELNIYNL